MIFLAHLSHQADKVSLGLIFFNTWFTDFFFKILRSGEGKKIKIKITKKIFFI